MNTNQCSSGFPARDLHCCGWGTLQAVCLTRSREAAKGNAQGQFSVFGGRAADGSPWVLGVAAGAISPFNFLRSTLYGRDAIATNGDELM